jgi:hypothetical protein
MEKGRDLPAGKRYAIIDADMARDPRLTLADIRVYIYLRSKTQSWLAIQDDIANNTGLNVRTVRDSLRNLEEYGYGAGFYRDVSGRQFMNDFEVFPTSDSIPPVRQQPKKRQSNPRFKYGNKGRNSAAENNEGTVDPPNSGSVDPVGGGSVDPLTQSDERILRTQANPKTNSAGARPDFKYDSTPLVTRIDIKESMNAQAI